MLKYFFFALIFFASFSSIAQTGTFQKPNNTRGTIVNGIMVEDELYHARKDTMWTPLQPGAEVYWENPGVDTAFWYCKQLTGRKWYKISSDGSIVDISGKLDKADTINFVRIQTQFPTATLTGTYSATTASTFALELMSAGSDLAVTLNWSGTRLAAGVNLGATATINTIVVDGVSQTFSQPAAGGTVSGTKSATVPRNVNKTFTNTVTTTDIKTGSATTTFTFSPKRYWFYSSSSTPASADVVAALGGSSELTSAKAKGAFDVVVTGTTKYVSYAYPSSYGALTSIFINGFETITAFTQTTVSVTNASGYTQNYYVYTSINSFDNQTVAFTSVN